MATGSLVVERRLRNSCDRYSPLVSRRPTSGGGTLFPCTTLPSSPCAPIYMSGCTLQDRFVSMETLTVFVMGLGVIVWKFSHDYEYSYRVIDMSHPDIDSPYPIRRCLIRLNHWPLSRLAILYLDLYRVAVSDRS